MVISTKGVVGSVVRVGGRGEKAMGSTAEWWLLGARPKE